MVLNPGMCSFAVILEYCSQVEMKLLTTTCPAVTLAAERGCWMFLFFVPQPTPRFSSPFSSRVDGVILLLFIYDYNFFLFGFVLQDAPVLLTLRERGINEKLLDGISLAPRLC